MRFLPSLVFTALSLFQAIAYAGPGDKWREETSLLDTEFTLRVGGNPALAPLSGKVDFDGTKAPSFAILSNDNYPTPEEREAVRFYGELRDEYMARFREIDRKYSNPYAQIAEASRNAMAILWADLYQGRLTYGQFAQSRQRVQQATRAEYDRYQSSMAARQADRDRQMTDLGASLLMRGMARPSAPMAPAPQSRSGLLKGSYVSGMNRICVYNSAGIGDFTTNVNAGEMCPMALP